MDERTVFENATAECGWWWQTQVNLFLEYISNQKDPATFRDWVIQKVMDEHDVDAFEAKVILGIEERKVSPNEPTDSPA